MWLIMAKKGKFLEIDGTTSKIHLCYQKNIYRVPRKDQNVTPSQSTPYLSAISWNIIFPADLRFWEALQCLKISAKLKFSIRYSEILRTTILVPRKTRRATVTMGDIVLKSIGKTTTNYCRFYLKPLRLVCPAKWTYQHRTRMQLRLLC